MTVRIVTDSTSDIPRGIVDALGITVVPVYIQFGIQSLRDGVDITREEFYERLINSPIPPTTSTCSCGDLVKAYQKLAKGTDSILSIHLSSKLSAVYSTALLAKETMEKEKNCRIIVIDSQFAAMASGLLVILAAKMAKEGKNLGEIVDSVEKNIPNVHFLAILDTLRYASKGGRVGKTLICAAQAANRLLNVKPMLTFKNGEVALSGMVRAQKREEKLMEFVQSFSGRRGIAVEYTTGRKEAEDLLKRIKAKFPWANLYLSQASPAIGTHAGPGTFAVSVLTE